MFDVLFLYVYFLVVFIILLSYYVNVLFCSVILPVTASSWSVGLEINTILYKRTQYKIMMHEYSSRIICNA